MTRRQQAAHAVAALFGATLFASEASARTETLRWTQVEPPAVAGFRVQWRLAGGATTTEDVGLPGQDAQGRFSSSLIVDDAVDVYIRVVAYDADGLESYPSNEICRGASGACASGSGTGGGDTGGGDTGGGTGGGDTGGGTGGGGTGTTAQAAITGFKLWNAANDTVIDSSFTNGETIQIGSNTCFAIEIVGNSYLSNNANGGSVKRQLNNSGGACTTPGVTHENSAPYGWEADEGPGKFACAGSLTQAGTHTLTVTPYDGRDCSGNAGPTVTLQFNVTAPLGAPGQPFLVQ